MHDGTEDVANAQCQPNRSEATGNETIRSEALRSAGWTGRPSDGPYPLLDLFSGYGGFSLAFEAVAHAECERRWGGTEPDEWPATGEQASRRDHPGRCHPAFATIGFSEIEPYACALLAHRFPGVPNLGPVQSVTRDRVLRECGVLPVVVTGGFPCQPHSTAGKRLAGADDRDLWAECVRVLREFRPRVAVFENVPGLLTSKSPAPDGRDGKGLFFNRVLSDLAEIGFACAWETLSAAQVGAPHKRDRIWLVCVDERWSLADSISQRGRGRDDQRQDAGDAVASGAADLRGWPAAHGLWPARPGETQYEWEPGRVVGDAASERPSPRRTEPAGLIGTASVAGASASAVGGQTQPLLGGNADGSAARLDPAPAEVREAPDDTVNRTNRLKLLGNGVLPACVMPFAVAIRDYLDGAQ